MRTEIPIPICADDVVESDNTETVNSKTPRSNPDPNLQTERFIFCLSQVPQFFANTGNPA